MKPRAIFYRMGSGAYIRYRLSEPYDGCIRWFCWEEDFDLNVREMMKAGYDCWFLDKDMFNLL